MKPHPTRRLSDGVPDDPRDLFPRYYSWSFSCRTLNGIPAFSRLSLSSKSMPRVFTEAIQKAGKALLLLFYRE